MNFSPVAGKKTNHITTNSAYKQYITTFVHKKDVSGMTLTAERDNPNYKLHYQYREYHLSPSDLLPNRPDAETKVDLKRIHNDYHTLGLVLSCFMNLGLSSRQTRNALKGLFGITISHQTVINYVNAAAAIINPWLDRNLPVPSGIAAADETYIIVENCWQYTWFIIDKVTRAICGYNISSTRGSCSSFGNLAQRIWQTRRKQ